MTWDELISTASAGMGRNIGRMAKLRAESLNTAISGTSDVVVLMRGKEAADREFDELILLLEQSGITRNRRGQPALSNEYEKSLTERKIRFGCSDKTIRVLNMASARPIDLLGIRTQFHERNGLQ